jgi:hypothetical protein
MVEAEFYKLLKDHGITANILTKEDFHILMKLYN